MQGADSQQHLWQLPHSRQHLGTSARRGCCSCARRCDRATSSGAVVCRRVDGCYSELCQSDEFRDPVDVVTAGMAASTSSTSGVRIAAATAVRAGFLALAIGLAIATLAEFARNAAFVGWDALPTHGGALRALTRARALTRPLSGHTTHNNYSLDICNASMPFDVKQQGLAYAFDLGKFWNDACSRVPANPAWDWKGRDFEKNDTRLNWCWEWMKQAGCYELMGSTGAWTWEDGQRRAASFGFAPYPEVVPMHPLRHPKVCERYEVHTDTHVTSDELEAADDWFRSKVNLYVLNLPQDIARWQTISARLNELGLNYSRVDGIDMRREGALQKLQENGLVPSTWNFSVAQANAVTQFNAMSGGIQGTVGCASAHLRALRTAQDKAAGKPLALILEDDVRLADNFTWRLRHLLEHEAPCDWAAISLKSKCPYGDCISRQLTRVWPDGNEPKRRCRHGVNYGFFAMLHRVDHLEATRTKLAEAVWDDERPHCLDVDVALASLSETIAYYAVPSLQRPGFLTEGALGSSRMSLDAAQLATSTVTSTMQPRTSSHEEARRTHAAT